MNNCIISIGVGKWYPQGIDRLNRSLDLVGYSGRRFLLKNYPAFCPTTDEVRCGFKPFTMNYFVVGNNACSEGEFNGNILWVDSSFWAIRDPQPIFDIIQRDGYYLMRGGWSVGQWCADIALDPLQITREEAFKIPDIVGGCIGLNMSHEPARSFLYEWLEYAMDGVTFHQPRWIKDGFVSDDERVLGHRSDQTVASVLAHRRGWKLQERAHVTFDWMKEPKKTICFIARGGVRDDDLEGVPYD